MSFNDFLLAFVPLFVAVDIIGTLPMFLGLTQGMDSDKRRHIIRQSILTALAVAIGFVYVGKYLFDWLGITMYDFMVAGGILLFIIATMDLLSGIKYARRIDAIGAVPLGIPLIVGPAVLTTALMIVSVHGRVATILAIIVNIGLAGLVLLSADFWARILGKAGSQAVSKVASLILAAIAVMMVRKGIHGIFPALVGQ
ncbi:MAG: MarC family protein [Phycisphaerae bacterium]|nr:MarC family protein [Phycisphaerae bacterium]